MKFLGAPFSLPVKDCFVVFEKYLGIASKLKTAVSTIASLSTLSNPLTCSLGIASLGIAFTKHLSGNKNLAKNRIREFLLKNYIELYSSVIEKNQVVLGQLLTELELGDKGDLSLSDYVYYRTSLADITQSILDLARVHCNDFRRALVELYIPQILDVRRFNKLIKKLSNKNEIQQLVMQNYQKIDGEYQYIGATLRESYAIKNIFDAIGYFTTTGYLKKFI